MASVHTQAQGGGCVAESQPLAEKNTLIQPQGNSGKTSFWRSNRGIAIVLLAVTAVLGLTIWFSDWAHQEVRDGFTLGGFPLFSVVLLTLSLVIMIFDGQARDVLEEVRKINAMEVGLVVATAAVIGLFFIAIPLIGFVPLITCLVAGGAAFLRYRPLKLAVLVGFCAACVLRVLLFFLGIGVSDGPIGLLFRGEF